MAKIHPALKNREFGWQDMTLIPNRLPDFERDEVDLSSYFSKRIKLKTPFVSSPMDTVTESPMAILMALFGGIGVIHYNFATVEEQIEEAKKVKKFQAAFVKEPMCLSPRHRVKDIYKINEKFGFFSTPITEDGTLDSRLMGIVTHRDVRYLEKMAVPLKKIMTPKERLITASRKRTLDKNDIGEANRIIRKYNLDTLPIVDDDFKLVALVTDSDLRKNDTYPLATKDENKQLRVFVAVESRLSLAKERIKKAVQVGVDGIVVDAGIVYQEQLELAKFSKQNFPHLEVILGNIASGEAGEKIIKDAHKWVDGLRVGVGPGAACITQQELGTGRVQASAVLDCAKTAGRLKSRYGPMPLISDGGIKMLENRFSKPGDISKALALGAQTVMMGSILASLDEAPGEKEFDYETERMVKKYRGMGSPGAMKQRAAVRYGIDKVKIKVAEGKEIIVPYRGSGYNFLPQLISGVKQSLQKQGFRNIYELQKYADIRPLTQ